MNWRRLRLRCGQLSRAKPLLSEGNRTLQIHLIDFDILPPGYSSDLHGHSTYEIIVLLDGCAVYSEGATEQRLGRGHVLLFPPHMKHIWHVSDMPCKKFVVIFSLEPAIEIPLPHGWPVSLDLVAEVEKFSGVMLESTPHELISVAVPIMRIINQALTIFCPNHLGGGRGKRKMDFIEEIERLVAKNLTYPFTLDELAAHFGICSRHLTYVLHREAGLTVFDCILAYRLRIARSLLLETDDKIRDIAVRVGIPNESYFFRCFRRCFGMTPNAYRQMARRDGRAM